MQQTDIGNLKTVVDTKSFNKEVRDQILVVRSSTQKTQMFTIV